MSHREDGEFELILGNKQLLSVLGVVIILLGVFFAMGFLAGRSTGPSVAAKTKASEPPTVIEPAVKPSASETAPAPAAEAAAAPAPIAEVKREEPTPPAPKTEAKQAAPKPPEPKREAAAPPKPAPPAPASSADGYYETAPKGTYLQVAATRRADAVNTRSLLMKNGMPAILTPSAKPELVRVLVGPIPDAETVARYRDELKKVGIGSPIVTKY